MANEKQTTRPASRLTTIKRIQRSREVQQQLEAAIRSGEFAPGERLPSERELVATFGVSRVSVREAIRSLEAVGRIKVEHGRGAFVTDRRSGFGETMTNWLEQHRDEVTELHQVRGALDVLAVEEAVRHFDEEHIKAIASAQDAFRAAVERGEVPPISSHSTSSSTSRLLRRASTGCSTTCSPISMSTCRRRATHRFLWPVALRAQVRNTMQSSRHCAAVIRLAHGRQSASTSPLRRARSSRLDVPPQPATARAPRRQ